MQQEMKYVYMVYKTGSFSKAAEELYMTQPALSISVSKVETELGMPLFNRNKKPLTLTEAGKLYINKYEQILHLENELAQQLADISNLQTGHLRVGGTHYFNSYILPLVISGFQKKWPGIQIELIEAGSYELLNMLRDNQIDLTFNCIPSPQDNFRRVDGFQDTILLAVPFSFPVNDALKSCALTSADILSRVYEQDDCPSVTLTPFEQTPFIILTPGNNLFSRCTDWFTEAQISPLIKMQVSQLVTAYHLAHAGIGATFISNWMVTATHTDMIYYKINSPMAVRNFDIVSSEKNYLSNAQKAFIQLFQAYYKDYINNG